MVETRSGSCLCGAVRFTIELPTKWVANCHCSMCRRAHGAPFVTWAAVEARQLNIESGSETLKDYDSSKGASRRFCSCCGSPLFFRGDRWPGEIHIARSAIHGTLDRMPQAHAFYSDRASWVQINDALPKLGGTTGVEPIDG